MNTKAWSSAPGIAARYSFHFQLHRSFGGVVGTDMEAYYDWSNNANKNLSKQTCPNGGLRPGPSFHLPSLLGGIAENFDSQHRILLMGQYTAAWFPWMDTCATNPTQPLSAITHSLSLLTQFDIFSEENRAWTFGFGYRHNFLRCVGKATTCASASTRTTVLEKLDLSSDALVFQLGMTWQTHDEMSR